MKKRWWLFIIVVFCSTVFAGFFLTNQLKVVSAWSKSDETPIVMKNKVWKVNFSTAINKVNVTNKYIFVIDSKGEKQDITLDLTDDLRTVIVYPPNEGYSLEDDSYTLHIQEGIQAKNGKKLHASEKLQFKVRDSLPVVENKTKLDEYFKNIIKQEKKNRTLFMTKSDGAVEESAMSDSKSADKSMSNSEVSETNVQVQGIDEADIVKTDGTYIYQVVDGKVRIIRAIPAQSMSLVTELTYSQNKFVPTQLFLDHKQLIVIGNSYQEPTGDQNSQTGKRTSQDRMIMPYHQATKVIVYNIEDVKNPKILREITVEGYLVATRKNGSFLYLISNHHPDYWILEKDSTKDVRPRVSDTAAKKESEPVDYKDIQYFQDSKESNFALIAALDLTDHSKEASITTYLGSGQQLYMSKENLYLAVTNYSNELIDTREYFSPDTNVYKFTIRGLNVEFNSTTEVPGTILNQFSMDESKGYFRVATTKGSVWDNEKPSSNNLYIFDEDLHEAGRLENLARGERIYSARFMGDRVYLVTFKETDPLFVIDTSNPSTPKVLGELKIPGFSNYLHPYDEDHIIGFGHDTKILSGKDSSNPIIRTNGVKISMFDVRDVNNPKEKFTEIIGGTSTYSPLNYDHKALLYHKSKQLFGFPIHVYEDVEGKEFEQTFEFQGAFVYKIDAEKGFQLKGKITHVNGKPLYEEWHNSIQRLVYIGDYLYALSPSKISSHNMINFQTADELSQSKSYDN